MMRRARLSVRPNVRPGGRAAGPAAARDGGVAPAAEPDPGKEGKTADPGESGAPEPRTPAVPPEQEEKPAEPIETAATVGHETPGRTTSTPLQRRKRISTLPNLVKPRVSSSASAVPPPKPSQVEAPSSPPLSPAPCKTDGTSAEKVKVLSPQKSQGLLSPPQGQLITLPEKRTPVPHVPHFSPFKKSVLKHQDVSPAKPVESAQKEDPSPLKERPSQKSCSNDQYEAFTKSQRKIITNNLEKERLQRAQKLRDLLKGELQKERKAWRAKHPLLNSMVELEKSKMTMRDFIHFIPMNNPMSSSLEESRTSEKSPPVEPPVTGLVAKSNAEEEDLDDDDDEEDDSQLLAPRVKVAEDGSIILDEESLTVEVIRAKAPIVEGNDPIFERGSTTTYSSFRRNHYSKPWSSEETDLFFLAISMVGTDFSMISHLFPHRERIEIKNKFKKEERTNGWRIDKAFREKKEFDFEFFAQLLEKTLEEGKKKKNKNREPRKTSTKPRKKQKDKAAAEQSLHDEDSVISEEEGADAGTAEKENTRSLAVDECSGATDPVKKKKAKRKKDNTKKSEEENRESQDEDLTPKPKKKSSKSKTPALDSDNAPELQSVDGDGNLKGTLAEKKTRVQKKKPNYKEIEVEDENDEEFALTENPEVDDGHGACDAGEADPSSPPPATTCEEENSLLLFTDDSQYQSGPDDDGDDDLSGMQHGLGEVNEAVSQASDAPLVAVNVTRGETEPMIVTQEESSCSASDNFDHSDTALDAASGRPSEQQSGPKDKPELPLGRRARPTPNLSRASVKKEVSAEKQSDHLADRNKDINVGKGGNKVEEECLSVEEQKQSDNTEKQKVPQGRRARPAPNLSRASIKEVSIEEQREPPEDHSNEIKAEKGNNKVQKECVSVAQPKQADGAENRGEDLSTAHDGDKESSIKPTLPARGKLQRPKPNFPARTSTRRGKPDVPDSPDVPKEGAEKCAETADVLTENKKEDAVKVPHVGIESPSPAPDGDQESKAKERLESSSGSQGECGKSSIKPAPLARGRFQRPKPNLMKATPRKGASEEEEACSAPSPGPAGGDTGGDSPGDDHSGKQENVMQNSGSSQDSHKSDIQSRSSSSTQDTAVTQDPLTEDSRKSESQDMKSHIEPAPLPRGRFQKPKPNLARLSERKAESEILEASSGEKRPARDDIGSSGAENIPGNGAEAASSLAKSDGGSSFTEEDSLTLEKCSNGASPGASAAPTAAGTDKELSAFDEQKTLKPVVARGRFQRPKPNLGKFTPRSAVTAPPVSTVQKEKRPDPTATDIDGSSMSVDAELLSDAENKSSVVKDTFDGAAGNELAQPKEAVNDTEKGTAVSLKPVRTRFPKSSPNLGRAVRKGTSTTDLSITKDLPDASIAGHVSKEAGHTTEEKSATIKPAQLKRGRLVRPVPNLGKAAATTSSPIQSKKTEDFKGSTTDKDKDPIVAIPSPNRKRKASDCNADLAPERLCPPGTTQKPKCLSDSEVEQPSLTDDPQSSSQTSSVQDLASLQRSRFGRPLRKLSTPPSASPKSENATDHPEKEKATRSVKSSTTKVSKPVTTKSKGKTTLVKIRATQQEEDEEEDADLGFDDENYDLSPDMQNQAPVFIPFHLRSPRPVPAEIEETVEELEIPVDMENGISQDLETPLFQHAVDPPAHADKKGQCDGSAEAAMTLISMGSSVYKPHIGEVLSPHQCTESDPSSNTAQSHKGPLPSPELPASPSSPHDNICAMENGVTVDLRIVEAPHCAPNPENETMNDGLAFPVEQSYPVKEEDADALQQDFSSQHVNVPDCLLGEQNTGEEATFILTLVEIPINEGYAFSCDSNMAESLPAPVLISSGSTEALPENLNFSAEAESHEPPTVSEEDQGPELGQTSRKRRARCIDDGDLPPLPKKPSVSEQVIDPKMKTAAVEVNGDGKASPEVSDTEPMAEEPAGVPPISATAVMEGPPVARTTSIVPAEMPAMSITDPSNSNLPLACASPVTTVKTTLKGPGRKPLGFLSLVCEEKQLKKTEEENQKNKNLPIMKCRKVSATVHSRQKESPDLTLENANDSEVPSSSAPLSPAELQGTTTEQDLPSISQIPDNQETELPSPSKSPDLATEEEAAPVSEYFFSDIFMEVDD